MKRYAVALTIPDNEAFTALEALRRIGLPVARVARADVWEFDVEPAAEDGLRARIESLETIFNPNKHRLIERDTAVPEPGEVWIAARDERPATAVGGRTIPGVRAIRRRTSWRLAGDDGRAVDDAILDRAIETFLCNPAFQSATTHTKETTS